MKALAAKAERGFRRFVVTAMHSPFSLPILGGSLFFAVAMGIHLGESSIGQINPIYFQEPPLHPRDRGAAIDETRLHQVQPAYADLYGWEQGHAAIAADCGNCQALHARDAYAYSAVVPYFGDRPRLRPAVARAPEPDVIFDEPVEDESPRQAAPIERYAHYAVSADEAVETADEATAEAAPLGLKKSDQE